MPCFVPERRARQADGRRAFLPRTAADIRPIRLARPQLLSVSGTFDVGCHHARLLASVQARELFKGLFSGHWRRPLPSRACFAPPCSLATAVPLVSGTATSAALLALNAAKQGSASVSAYQVARCGVCEAKVESVGWCGAVGAAVGSFVPV